MAERIILNVFVPKFDVSKELELALPVYRTGTYPTGPTGTRTNR